MERLDNIEIPPFTLDGSDISQVEDCATTNDNSASNRFTYRGE